MTTERLVAKLMALKDEIDKEKAALQEAKLDAEFDNLIIKAYDEGRWQGDTDPNFNWSDLEVQ